MGIRDAQHLKTACTCAVLAADPCNALRMTSGRGRVLVAELIGPARHHCLHSIAEVDERFGALRPLDSDTSRSGDQPPIAKRRFCSWHALAGSIGARFEAREGASDPADFPFEHDARSLENSAPYLLAEAFEIGRGGVAGINQKIGVFWRNQRPAAPQAAAACGVDQPPRQIARWITEGRAAGAGTNRLARSPCGADLGHSSGDYVGVIAFAAQPERRQRSSWD